MQEPLNIADQIRISVSLAEGQFREFKSALEGPPGQKKPRSTRTICQDVGEALVAFANSDGGELIIGVEDDGDVTGVNQLEPSQVDLIKGAAKTHVHATTPIPSIICRTTDIDGKKVIYFRVSKSTRSIHLTSDGRCMRRSDLASIPTAPEVISFDRIEVRSREYDREFLDGCSVADLDSDLIRLVAEQISPGISIDRCLQYLGLAEYDGIIGLRVRRAAALLFAKNTDKWHPRLQVRILRVQGVEIGVGGQYNVKSDETVKGNIVRLIDDCWEQIRPHLVETRFHDDARFKSTFIYPEVACREALVNAIAHRDYSEEGLGIEVYVFDDRIEVRNPGNLLSSITLAEIKTLTGIHQSRNSYISRTLREIGLMRELGEGMRRIFEVMRHSEMAEPEISSTGGSFSLILLNKAMYSRDELLFIEGYKEFKLSAEEKSVILMARRGELISANDIWTRVGIVDTEHYRQLVDSLQRKKILGSEIERSASYALAKKNGVSRRSIARYKIVLPENIRNLSLQKDPPKTTAKIARQVEPTKKTVTQKPRVALNTGTDCELFLSNIPPNTTERDISVALTAVAPLEDIYIPRGNDGLTRGYAFVTCSSKELAAQVMNSDIRIGNRKIIAKKRIAK
jgi:ATP-dependent DNA helicase RecG